MPMLADFVDDEAAEAIDELGPWKIAPYDFQIEGFSRTVRAFADEGCKSALVVMPTGAGKTIFFMMIARWVIEDMGGRVLVIAHTGELIEQACHKAQLAGMKATVERAGDHARPDFTRSLGPVLPGHDDDPLDPKLVVATVQTLQGKRLKAWPPGHFDLIVVDEAHHAEAQTYRNTVSHLAPKWIIGLTATADRGDGKPIVGSGNVFERLTYEVFLHELVRRGFLKRPIVKVLDTTIDLSALRVTGAKDLNDHEIEELLLPHVSEIVNELKEKLQGHRAVIFTPQIASAEAIASAFGSLGVSCGSVSGVDKDRSTILAGFRHGRYQHIANAMLLTEGWDETFVDSVVILRATKSRSLYCQMAGRGLRKHPGLDHGYIWGVNWKTHDHDLVHPVQIFDSPNLRINPEIIAAAQSLVDSGEELDIALALKQAQTERKERKRIQLQVKEATAKAEVYTLDPLANGQRPIFNDASPSHYEDPASERQVEALVKFGIDRSTAMRWPKKQASGFIGKEIAAKDAGKPSYKQIKYLRSLGHPSPAKLSRDEAKAEIDRMRNRAG